MILKTYISNVNGVSKAYQVFSHSPFIFAKFASPYESNESFVEGI